MIIDCVTNLRRYEKTLPHVNTICRVIESGVLKDLAVGKYKTDNPNVRYNIFSYETERELSDTYEVHRKEIDVQILLEGKERMDIAWPNPVNIVDEYNEDTDAAFVSGNLCASYHASVDQFVVFFQGEPHAPSLKDSETSRVKKVVFKVLSEQCM